MGGPSIANAIIALVAGVGGGVLSRFLGAGRRRLPGAGASAGMADGPIRVRRLTLVDDSGRERALLRLLDGGVTLLLTDEAMSWRVLLSAGERGPFLRFYEEEINSRLGIGILRDGFPGLELADADGTARASLSLDAAGRASFALRDKTGVIRASFEVSADGDPSLVFADINGNTLVKFP